MTTPAILYHGTSRGNAKKILAEGFRRAKHASYTGTGVNLSQCMTVSYEYGEYEHSGCVLQVALKPDTRWNDANFRDSPDFRSGNTDEFFRKSGLDALCTFSGNVWIVWNPEVIVDIRMLSHEEAVARLVSEFEEDGPNCAYNGVAGTYAELYHNDLRPGSGLDDPQWKARLSGMLRRAQALITPPNAVSGRPLGMALAVP